MEKTCKTCGNIVTDSNNDSDYCFTANNLDAINENQKDPDFICPDWIPDIL